MYNWHCRQITCWITTLYISISHMSHEKDGLSHHNKELETSQARNIFTRTLRKSLNNIKGYNSWTIHATTVHYFSQVSTDLNTCLVYSTYFQQQKHSIFLLQYICILHIPGITLLSLTISHEFYVPWNFVLHLRNDSLPSLKQGKPQQHLISASSKTMLSRTT